MRISWKARCKGPDTLPERSAAVGRAYVRFALEEQTCYRLIFDFAEIKGDPVPELARGRSPRPRHH